jgi:hypothetical protein
MKLLKIAPFAVIGIVLIFAVYSYVTHPYMRTFRRVEHPALGTPLADARCTTCHTKPPGRKNLNPYGKDLQKHGGDEAAFRAIGTLDSDKDGATNAEEIKAGTLPGDPKSKPTSR